MVRGKCIMVDKGYCSIKNLFLYSTDFVIVV